MDQPGIRFFESCGYGALLFARTTWRRRERQRNSETSRSRLQDFQSDRFLSVTSPKECCERSNESLGNCSGAPVLLNHKMIAPLAKLIDWLSIQKNFRRIPPIDGQNLRLEEALQFLKSADFIPAETQPAKVEFNPDKSGLHFRFSTPRPGAFAL